MATSLRRMMGAASRAVDQAAAFAIRVRGEPSNVGARTHAERLLVLEQAALAYRAALPANAPASDPRSAGGALHDPDVEAVDEPYFHAPPAIAPSRREVRSRVFDLSWRSDYSPWLAEIREAFAATVENRTARARLFVGKTPRRPAVILIHGYMGGHWIVDEASWPTRWLQNLGLDVALFVLPFHGLRAGVRRGAPRFPGREAWLSNEAFGQSVFDIRALAMYLRERGAPHVGTVGVSLGGLTASLIATVTSELDFVVPMTPLASVADVAFEQGFFGESREEARKERDALDIANQVVSPFTRPLRMSPARVFVVGAADDQITPLSHATRIARHFDCELFTLRGGHILQPERDRAFQRLRVLLETERIIAKR